MRLWCLPPLSLALNVECGRQYERAVCICFERGERWAEWAPATPWYLKPWNFILLLKLREAGAHSWLHLCFEIGRLVKPDTVPDKLWLPLSLTGECPRLAPPGDKPNLELFFKSLLQFRPSFVFLFTRLSPFACTIMMTTTKEGICIRWSNLQEI